MANDRDLNLINRNIGNPSSFLAKLYGPPSTYFLRIAFLTNSEVTLLDTLLYSTDLSIRPGRRCRRNRARLVFIESEYEIHGRVAAKA